MKTITEHIIVDEKIDVPSNAFPIYGHANSMVQATRVKVFLREHSDSDRKIIVYEIQILPSNSRIWSVLMHYESEISSDFPPNIKILDPIGSFMNILGLTMDGVKKALDMAGVSNEK